MEKKNLMIGDWVVCDNTPYQIAEIGGMVCLSFERELFAALEDIQPIPLTPEILEKNGIVFDYTIKLYDDYGNLYEIKGYALHGTTKWGDDYLLQYDEDKGLHISTEIYGEITLHNINFIHQLQHALRLCGIEKEIEI